MPDLSLSVYRSRVMLAIDQGELYRVWKRPRSDFSREADYAKYHKSLAGEPAAYYDKQYGYMYIDIDGVKLLAHRVVYAMYRELEPYQMPKIVDHVDGDTCWNYYTNLRAADSNQNGMNKAMQSNNTSGYKGISWSERDQRYHAYINVRGKRVWQAWFKADELEIAAAARAEKARELHGEFYSDGVR